MNDIHFLIVSVIIILSILLISGFSIYVMWLKVTKLPPSSPEPILLTDHAYEDIMGMLNTINSQCETLSNEHIDISASISEH